MLRGDMKTGIYFLAIFFTIISSCILADQPVYDEVIQAVRDELEPRVLEVSDDSELESEDFDQEDFGFSLDELDALEKEDQSWTKVPRFLLAALSVKAESAKVKLNEVKEKAAQHISEHKQAYAITTVLGTAAAVVLIMYLLRPELFSRAPETAT